MSATSLNQQKDFCEKLSKDYLELKRVNKIY